MIFSVVVNKITVSHVKKGEFYILSGSAGEKNGKIELY